MKDMHPDRDPRHLGELLRGAVPDGPDPAGRADQVVRRARRATRRRGTVSAFAVGVVALSVIVGPHLIPSSPVSNDASPGVSSPGPHLTHPFECPSPDRTPAHFTKPSTDAIPPGAVLARICPVLGKYHIRWSAPLDALTTNVGAVADAYNKLPKAQALPCPGQLTSTGFTVTFQYADGSLVQLSADTDGTGGCDFISIDGRNELGKSQGGTVLTRYLSELERQRATAPPLPLDKAAVACPRVLDAFVPGLIPSDAQLNLTKATYCAYPGPASNEYGSYPLTAAQVRVIDDDYAAKVSHHADVHSCVYIWGPAAIVGETAWGDQVKVVQSHCGPWSRGSVYWPPSHSVSNILNHLLGR